ncbi:pentapeptide repeat-containing protein [Streptoverticillium reticulum]|uniref:pentapeptide repeat-containing protein n=1 Tax=Streptoverticillium reticulum TaxID=1433415 RepID=UPI0039BF703B
MEFRDLGDGRSLQRPSIDHDDLVPYTGAIKGELSVSMSCIDGTDATGAVVEGTVTRSVLDRVQLTNATVAPFRLDDTAVRGADLSNSRWRDVHLSRVELAGCRGIGWQLAATEAGDVYAEDCRFDMATIALDKVRGVVAFVRCSFKEASFSGRLDRVIFHDCDLSNAEFAVTSAKGCDLRGAELRGARGLLSLRGARINATQVVTVAELLATEAGLMVEP